MVDGRPVALTGPALPAAMPGVLRGEGIFESFLRDEAGRSPFLERHARRLEGSAALLRMDLEGVGLLEDWPRFAPLVPGGPWRVRHTVLRGRGGGLARVWSAGRPLPVPAEAALVLSPFRRDPLDPIVSAKTISRAGSQLARRMAREQGAWEALLLTVDGHLSECTSTNLFLVRDGVVCTPSLDCGILPGVTRGVLLEALRAAGEPVAEERMSPEALREAEEVFVTNAIYGAIPVGRILDVREDLPGRQGAVLRRVQDLYRESALRSQAPGRTEA